MSVFSSRPVLVERERELAELDAALGAASEGQGGVVVLEAPAGQGKTALLRALRTLADERGFHGVMAVGSEFERDFSFGIARQLFETAAHGPDRNALFAGAAEGARGVFSPSADPTPGTDLSFARLHGLYWFTANLAARAPLLVVIDDAHWADAPSLRFADVLARRIEDLPVVLAMAVRSGEQATDPDALDQLAASPTARIIRPESLSDASVGAILSDALGADVDDAVVAAAVETTAGNPLFVRELVRSLAESGSLAVEDPDAVRRAVPSTIARSVVGRLRRLSPDALAVARSLAVLGERATLARVVSLAEVPENDAVAAHATLVRADLIDADAMRFRHPMVRAAVHADLIGGERSRWHRRAATLLAEDGADAGEVAAHLLLTEASGDGRAARALQAAGWRALTDGAPDVALRLLRRALAEPPDDADRAEVLLGLGQARARTGESGALEDLERAAEASEGEVALRADQARARLLVFHDRPAEGFDALRRALDAATAAGSHAIAELQDDLIDVLAHHPAMRDEYMRLLEDAAEADRPTALAHLAFANAVGGAPAGDVVALALRALRAGGSERGAFVHWYAIESLMAVEAAAEAADALRAAQVLAHRHGSRLAPGPLTYMTSAWSAWERAFGDLRAAEDEARRNLDLVDAVGAESAAVGLGSTLGAVLLDRGRIEEADALLSGLPKERPGAIREAHGMRARLRLEQGRVPEALEELETELAHEQRRGWVTSNREPSRQTLVRALVAAGRADEAREAADEQVRINEARGVHGAIARARLARALVVSPDAARDEIHAAVEAAERSPSAKIRAEALAELGMSLRRAGRRAEARERLREARELAYKCGADGLEARVHEELVIAGGRPQRVALSGLASLTAAERRVAGLAAEGLRNREIAERLFVTLKTVEVHLRHSYDKLGIQGRSQLADALANEAAAPNP